MKTSSSPISKLLPWCIRLPALVVAFASLPTSTAAQDTTSEPPSTIVVLGEVLDSGTRMPIPGALVEVISAGVRVFSDSMGAFRIPGVEAGSDHQVRVSQLGYITLSEITDLLPGEVVTVWLTAKPIELEGLVVTVNRLERRRRAFSRAVRVLSPEAIQMSAALDGRELLERIPGALTVPCGLDDCVLRRGRYEALRVVVDEMPTFGGLRALEAFPATEIHSMEYVPSCSVVRVYTRHFIERTAARGGRTFFSNLCLY